MSDSYKIPLTKGYEAEVDYEDYLYLKQWKWCVKIGGTGGDPYAARTQRLPGNKFATIRMHRLIMRAELAAAPEGYEVDHVDFDTLNNRRSNLEVISKAENLARRRYDPPEVEVDQEYTDDIPF